MTECGLPARDNARWYDRFGGSVGIIARPGLAEPEAARALAEAMRQSSPKAFLLSIAAEMGYLKAHPRPHGHLPPSPRTACTPEYAL